MEKNIKKSQNLSKHGVENVVTIATCDTVDAKFFQNLVHHGPINFSKSGHIW